MSIASGPSKKNTWFTHWFWLILFLCGAGLTISGSYAAYRWEAARLRHEKYTDLASIAGLKAQQIELRLQERKQHAMALAQWPEMARFFQSACDKNKNPSEWMALLQSLEVIAKMQGYERVELLGPQADIRWSKTGESHLGSEQVAMLVRQAIDSPDAIVSDLHGQTPAQIHLDVVAAVRDAQGEAIGVILLSVLASDYLYPFLQSWPTPSPSSETLLVRRDGDHVLFLNELRHRHDTALKYRQPLSHLDLPATQAVLGKTGSFFGRDYRGIKVLADLRPIADTPWFLVTKIDADEVMADLTVIAGVILLLALLMVAGFAGTSAYFQKSLENAQHQLAEAQMRQMMQKLARANQELRQFASIISHDLRSPLVNLQGFSAELAHSIKPISHATEVGWNQLNDADRQAVELACRKDIPEALGFIQSAVQHMDNYISSLLKLSRLGHTPMTIKTLNMPALWAQTLQAFAHQIKEQGIQVNVGALPELQADEMLVKQMLANLLDNAIKYLAPERPGQIDLRGWRTDKEVFFCLSDNGRGIAKDDMDKVFAPFRRAGKNNVPGEGMGLAYVQAIMNRHTGRITCWSELGVGSKFTLVFPISPSGA